MGRVNFSLPATIDEFQAGDRASFVVGLQNEPSKQPIANSTGGKLHHAVAFLFKDERCLSCVCKSVCKIRRFRSTQPRQFGFRLVKAGG